MVLFQIIAYCVFIVLGVVCNLLVVPDDEVTTWPIFLTISSGSVFALCSLVPGMALTVRRLHGYRFEWMAVSLLFPSSFIGRSSGTDLDCRCFSCVGYFCNALAF